MKRKKKLFEIPYAGIDELDGVAILYSKRGDYSVVLKIENPVLQYGADAEAYNSYHNILLNVVKILGEGFIIQKQDVFIRKEFCPKPSIEFLKQKYNEHFQGRKYTALSTYFTITRQVKKSAFYVFNKNHLLDFLEVIAKITDILNIGGISSSLLKKEEINLFVIQLLGMKFSRETLSLNNIRSGERQLQIGDVSTRIISLVDTETVDLPEKVSPYIFNKENRNLKEFPMDNLECLFRMPETEVVIYNQLIEVPPQQLTINNLELKKKRHSGVPDPANAFCVKDIESLLEDLARESQILVNAHFSILISAAPEFIDKAANFVESALFQQGIIPSSNAYNQLELFRAFLPGNAIELKHYDWFLTTPEAALCFFFKESLVKDDPSNFLIHFTDRQGVPVGIDPSDFPINTNRINNRNRFVLGPSGSGKSFLMNAFVEQYMYYNTDVVIVDTGHSYSGLCDYFAGKYITYTDEKPITMNPFQIEEEEYNIEKKDFLCTLIGLLWKGVDGQLSSVERDVISNLISSYYSNFFNPPKREVSFVKLSFNSFYEFALARIPIIKQEERIAFDLDEFRYVLKKFYRGGEFEPILNEAADSSLFSERFIVFEIDAVKENKILFPIVTLIIMDVFIQKMRRRKDQRKALIIEEAWKAIASPMMAGYILYLYKTVRKFWGEAIVVTQELSDILGNTIVKDSILNNSDTVFLLDQSKFKESYDEIARLLSITEVERRKIFTINTLDNKEGRARFKEVYIRRGSTGEVYGIEVSLFQYLTYTTEKPEKSAVESYVDRYSSYQEGLTRFIQDFQQSKLDLSAFVKTINSSSHQIFT
ncbi:TraG family conjugative transposon ATPase [Desertivirga xinjiangensis]|uniref:TraG family conjugative transposon ATPase n=1 Tax=Desertivirga xinjiangensis TaxID=539206 RepID=UPI0021088BDF|nr:TraG family conjugative transposon ATPase [Pedobacter xinjiangensis]